MSNYVLGRGKLYFDPFTTGTTTKTGERYLGNTPEFNISIESEKLDHFNADSGVRVKDNSVTLEVNRSGSFIVDDISADNVALFFLGTKSTITDAGLSNQVQNITGAIGGRYYQLGTAVNKAGLRDVSIDSIMAGATTLALTTDYTLEAELGRIYIVAGGAGDAKNLTVTYDTAANSRTQVVTGAAADVEGALRFVAYNAEGDQRDFYMPYVRLAPSGDFALKGDEWQQLPFNVEILKLNDTTEALYIDGRPV